MLGYGPEKPQAAYMHLGMTIQLACRGPQS